MHTTSASLLKLLRKPNETEAWSRFVRLYSPMVYDWARRMGLQDADAADLVQEVFATLVEKLPAFRYDDHKSFRAWLCTITRNKWRKRRRGKKLPVEGDARLQEVSESSAGDFDEVEFRRHLLTRILLAVQERFEANTWKAFWEHMVEGRPAQEVAKELGVSTGAVYTAKCRVLAYLSKEMEELEINN